MKKKLIKKIIDWTLYILTLVYILTGLGITQYQIAELLTFGLLNKSVSINVHQKLLIPFITLLSIHILFRPISKIINSLK